MEPTRLFAARVAIDALLKKFVLLVNGSEARIEVAMGQWVVFRLWFL